MVIPPNRGINFPILFKYWLFNVILKGKIFWCFIYLN